MLLYYDFHIHSCLSPCAHDDMTPVNIANMAALAGLDVIAVCDHNSVKNCAAVINAAARAGVLALPGIELTVTGDAHVLCLFETLEAADAFGSLVYSRLPSKKNRPELFGRQLIFDEHDVCHGEEERLLMSAADIDIFEVGALAEDYGGIAIPAHIDRQAFSLLSAFGFYSPEMGFRLAETLEECDCAALRREHPELECVPLIKNSDAHRLDMIYDARYALETERRTPASIISALGNYAIPKKISKYDA